MDKCITNNIVKKISTKILLLSCYDMNVPNETHVKILSPFDIL